MTPHKPDRHAMLARAAERLKKKIWPLIAGDEISFDDLGHLILAELQSVEPEKINYDPNLAELAANLWSELAGFDGEDADAQLVIERAFKQWSKPAPSVALGSGEAEPARIDAMESAVALATSSLQSALRASEELESTLCTIKDNVQGNEDFDADEIVVLCTKKVGKFSQSKEWAAQAAIREIEAELSTAQTRIASLEAELAKVMEVAGKNYAEFHGARTRAEKAEAELKEAREDIARTGEKVRIERDRANRAESALRASEERCNSRELDVKLYMDLHEAAQTKIATLEAELKEARELHCGYSKALEEVKLQRFQAESRATALQERINQLEVENRALFEGIDGAIDKWNGGDCGKATWYLIIKLLIKTRDAALAPRTDKEAK